MLELLRATPFTLLTPPYQQLHLVTRRGSRLEIEGLLRGCAVVWHLQAKVSGQELEAVRNRSPGLALIAILPPAHQLQANLDVLRVVEFCRPQSILPFQARPDAEELSELLRRAPTRLEVDLTDYLVWRGLRLDRDTRHLIRRTIELSNQVRTISALARGLYLSRRALGRRFLSKGLPVPSHWLQFARVLRATITLQSTGANLFAVAGDLGYPDGFAFSNQMVRLTGVRPSSVRELLGWEWLVEAWLDQEAACGGLRSFAFDPGRGPVPEALYEPPREPHTRSRSWPRGVRTNKATSQAGN